MSTSEIHFKMEMGSSQYYRLDEFLNLIGEFVCLCVLVGSGGSPVNLGCDKRVQTVNNSESFGLG